MESNKVGERTSACFVDEDEDVEEEGNDFKEVLSSATISLLGCLVFDDVGEVGCLLVSWIEDSTVISESVFVLIFGKDN